MRPSRDEWAMGLAQLTAKRATCLRRQVGCVLLDARGFVLATGYNGVAAGLPHCNDYMVKRKSSQREFLILGRTTEERIYPHACPAANLPPGVGGDGCEAIHAEQNSLLQCRDVHLIDTCYTTASPCMTCTKLLLNTSCKRVVYLEEYPSPQSRVLWEKAGRLWVKHEPSI